ncbi:MAG: hypothetical protein R3336_01540 [Phycisphaeraceae bacterium]|nr:hypothetical protein [Phycisphaeraceae bacterium]
MATATDMIELACPGCGEMLEIDAGFAGGVCRCYSCGTLMTVPDDPAQGSAEQLRRPDRPEGPSGGRPERPSAPGEAPQKPAATPSDEEPTVDLQSEQVFLTSSGKAIRIHASDVPVAQAKRKVVKGTVWLLFIGMIVFVIAMVVAAVGIVLHTGEPPVEDPDDKPPIVEFSHEVQSNPFMVDKATLMDFSLAANTAIVVEADDDANPWLGLLKDAIRAAAEAGGEDLILQAVFAREGEAVAVPAVPAAMDESGYQMLDEKLRNVYAYGVSPIWPALDKALEIKPEHLILVLDESLSARDADRLAEEMGDKGVGVKLDLLVMGEEPTPEMKAVLKSFRGTWRRVRLTRLERWYDEYRDAEAAAAAP